ncbi:hypothetical protein [Brevibacillus nitrificans]|uniref:hypothetical protein n=1 Tax=Brevibacillus nitrificans TaxID=651560 RepID=UPI002623796F|nr:hypothetical protein [Brevibacillus nitrificans]
MNKKMIIVSALLSLSLLAACGNPEKNNHAAGHGETNNQAADNHGGHGAEEQPAPDKHKASFAFASGGARAKEETEVTIQITNADGTPVNDYEVNHEKLLHLIMVNHDLSYFAHIHPDFKGDGKFVVKTSFPAGGKYKAFADFKPAGGSSTTLSEWMDVEGKEGEHAAVTPDPKLVKVVGDKEITLALSSTKAKEEVTLTYDIRDAKTKQGIDSLEPYLGAVGHVVILSDDAGKYLHVHPLDEKATGPKAQFATSFPQSGIYKIWGQFQHKGDVITVPFVVEVK